MCSVSFKQKQKIRPKIETDFNMIKLKGKLSQSYSFKSNYFRSCFCFYISTYTKFVVFYKVLVYQSIVFKETTKFPFCDIVKHSLWFAFLTQLVFSNFDFFVNCSLIYTCFIQSNRIHRSSLHSYIFSYFSGIVSSL